MDKSEDVPEAALDPAARDIFLWLLKGIWWLLYPITIGAYYLIYYLSFAAVFAVKLLYQPFIFILAPILYLVQFLWACFLAPFQFAARFETLYIYLSIAALIGLLIGLGVNFLYSSLQTPLGLGSTGQTSTEHDSNKPSSTNSGRTAKEYRREKRKQKQAPVPPSLLSSSPQLSPTYGSGSLSDGLRKGKRGKGLTAQTIMEELDSDY